MRQFHVELLIAPTNLSICHDIRRKVFHLEQGISEKADFDELDQQAGTWHLLGRVNDEPAGTLRVVFPEKGKAKVGRVCTLLEYRGQGLAKLMMEQVLADLPGHQVSTIELSAQAYLEKFYRDLGFELVGKPYDEVGFPHIRMAKHLDRTPDRA